MVTWDAFEGAAGQVLARNIQRVANPPQHDAIAAPVAQSLFIVAGPGSGKTTVIALRIIKLILVDGISPDTILATTFTKKAAAELRSRVLGWGDTLRQHLVADPAFNQQATFLRAIDFNQVISGTIDSIAEEILSNYRAPGVGAPIVLEDFVANALMLRAGLFAQGRHRSQSLRALMTRLNGTALGINAATLSAMLREISDRFAHDAVDVGAFRAGNSADRGVQRACEAIADYSAELQGKGLYDFAKLGAAFLTDLPSPRLGPFLDKVRFVLVDEYQDTNLMQERIYFALASASSNRGGSITVVGDDDQSLYRFRGATVDLFTGFAGRIAAQGIPTQQVYLSNNYRSTTAVVDFVNGFARLDPAFAQARVQGKPAIVGARAVAPVPYVNYPVLGMFRDTVQELGRDLAIFIDTLVYGAGHTVRQAGGALTVRVAQPGGSPADMAVLTSSPQEFSSGGNPRLPLVLRSELARLQRPIQVFNPRGQSLGDVQDVQQLCGLVLECIDPGGAVEGTINTLPADVVASFQAWRAAANRLIAANPNPRGPRSLGDFVRAWGRRQAMGRRLQAREDVPLNDLVYKLVTWLPAMQDDVESLVYLEAITRAITQSSLFGSFGGEIVFEPGIPQLGALAQASVREAIWNIFLPMASGTIDVNEDLLETLPSNRLSIMSIHQAKGLEFPLVIVDVGSDFRTRHHAQAFKRFPHAPGRPCNLEDALRPYSPLGAPQRIGIDRAFDDLVRQYFVAFSRAKDVLLLVGLTSVRDMQIPNIATGWDRGRTWHWGAGLRNLLHI